MSLKVWIVTGAFVGGLAMPVLAAATEPRSASTSWTAALATRAAAAIGVGT